MLAFPGMIRQRAWNAGIRVPPDPDRFDPEEFPHFQVFCNWQLGRPISYSDDVSWNASVIANIPDEEIRNVLWSDLEKMGAV